MRLLPVCQLILSGKQTYSSNKALKVRSVYLFLTASLLYLQLHWLELAFLHDRGLARQCVLIRWRELPQCTTHEIIKAQKFNPLRFVENQIRQYSVKCYLSAIE